MFCAFAAQRMIAAIANTTMVMNTANTIGWSKLSLNGTGNLLVAGTPRQVS